ncbi:MAG: hypothetical protein GYB65_20460 [Chloroflexi bacterium]|nr:hypothetical protein [Chloroflexota bacterium]
MSEKPNGHPVNEAEPIPAEKVRRSNGSRPRTANRDPIPGINLRELYEERNWTALAGLGLVGLGLLFLVEQVLDIDINLWGAILVLIGGGLLYTAWEEYNANHQTWTDRARKRLTGGAVIGAIGILATFDINWWGAILLAVGGWLAYTAYQRYEANNNEWTDRERNRLVFGAILGVVGVLVLVGMGWLWPLVIIVTGAALLFSVFKERQQV